MSSARVFLSGVVLILIFAAFERPSQAQAVGIQDREPPSNRSIFTIQVASFPSLAEAKVFITQLEKSGERPLSSEVEIPGRGKWTRVLIGSFQSTGAAYGYARNLAGRGVIKEYLVKPAVEPVFDEVKPAPPQPRPQPPRAQLGTSHELALRRSTVLLPSSPTDRALANPAINAALTPKPDPVLLAFNLLCSGSEDTRGGLWLRGDIEAGLARLRWIAGPGREDMLSADNEGRVVVSVGKLAGAAGFGLSGFSGDPLAVADFISSDEGLLLLVQVTQGKKRYVLHLGKHVATLDGSVEVGSSINLDNGFDSRINPVRRNRQKLGNERPPAGFDCLIAINPSVHWAKLNTGQTVPDGMVAFHELAEAYAKVEQGLQYLPEGSRPGAHSIAIDREIKLQSSGYRSGLVLTEGLNRVFRSEKEIAAIKAQSVLGR